jgi:D-beta-D-heptose 7-phosphate kinase/D-beta-D-heptose 1-phosphate adenosyltransferase
MKDHAVCSLLSSFAGKRVLVLGDVMLDEYVWGEARRISPEAPVLVVESQRRTYVAGGAGNAAANVVALGGQALLCGVAGNDHQAEQLRDALVQGGVGVEGLFTEPGRTTTTKTRIIAHQQQVVRLDCEHRAPLPVLLEDRLLGWVEEQLPAIDVCVLSDYAKGVVSAGLARRLLDMALRARKPVLVDPKGDDTRKYAGATLVKPNAQEAQRLMKAEFQGIGGAAEAGRQLVDLLDVSAVLITLGAQGMTLCCRGVEPVHIRSAARSVFDVTGAGDTVMSTLALAVAAGATLEQAARLGNRAAGIAVAKVGTSTVTLEELGSRKSSRRHAGRPGKPRMSPAPR